MKKGKMKRLRFDSAKILKQINTNIELSMCQYKYFFFSFRTMYNFTKML